jgi:hypothetical protein
VHTTSVEHDTDEKAAARAATAHRRDAALPLHARMLLGLQATAGNAAVADLIETGKPTVVSPPPLGEGRVGDDAAPIPETAEAPSAEEAVATPRTGETDDELAALDAEADGNASISPPALGEGRVGDGESGDVPDALGGVDPGAPIEERPAPVGPDVTAADPAAGLARVGSLPPGLLLSSLGGVSTAVDRQAATEHERLAANAPQRPRHPGAPSTVESPAATRLAPADRPTPGGLPAMPEGRNVEVRSPPAGTLPHLSLEGNADPALIHQQHERVLSNVEREHVSGRQEATRPLGEDEIFPTVPPETLRGSIGAAPTSAGNAAGQPKPAEDDEAASIVAQQEKGAEIQSAVGSGLASLAGQREEYAQRTAGERAKAEAEMSQLERENSHEQAGERAAARTEMAGLRGQWTTAQAELVAGAQSEATAKTTETLHTVAKERGAAEEQATAHYEQGQQEAQRARHEAEQQAAAERQKAQGQNQGGLLGAIGSAAQSLFDKAKQAVQSVFDRARQLVRGAIERAQQLAMAVMERARSAIVGAIRMAGSVLSAIGDRVLVAFPALRDRFRKAIQDRIAAAEATVNRLANALKHAVQTALTLLGTALSAAIGLLQQGMQAALDGVRAVVHGALEFARGALAAFGTFAVLVKDIAANPGRWIANLAAGVKDGIQNYLWVEIEAAVQGWFHDKVQQVVGVGEAIWHLLQRGGISIADVARMAWDGLKAAIPGILIALLIEKLMSLIVPAVGAILTIIQAIQAGWASLGRILQAFDAFFNFLKHVKLGSAGPLFAKAVAAGAIAAVEFVSNFLVTRLKGAASSVSNRLRALARRIGERLRAIGGRIVAGVKAVGSGLRRAGQKVRAGFDRLRGKHPKSHADQERAKHERQEAAFVATKSRLDALFARGVSKARLVTEVSWLKIRYRWGSLHVQGATEARHVAVSGGFSPERTVTAGQVTEEAETLEQLLSRYPKAKRKLQQVRDDPYIDTHLKASWMRTVEARLRQSARHEAHVNPYEVMVTVAAANRANFFLGPRIEVQEIVAAEGLLKYVDVAAAFRRLKPELIAEYVYPIRWVRAITEHKTAISANDFAVDAEVPGHFWSARRDAVGAGELALKHMRLQPSDYPKGAISFVLPKEAASIPELHKPTAFDGMFFPKWAPSEPSFKWGLVPPHEALKAGIKEGVSRTQVPISSTILHEYVPPGVYK